MLSGNPVLSFRLAGIPDEYYTHLKVIREASIDAVYEALDSVFKASDEENRTIGERARCFVLGTKNYYNQTAKIFQFVSNGCATN